MSLRLAFALALAVSLLPRAAAAFGVGASLGYEHIVAVQDSPDPLTKSPISSANGWGLDLYVRPMAWTTFVPELQVGYHRSGKSVVYFADSPEFEQRYHSTNTFIPILLGARFYLPVVPVWLEGHAGIGFLTGDRPYGGDDDKGRAFTANAGAGVELIDLGRTQLGLLVRYTRWFNGGQDVENYPSFGMLTAAFDVAFQAF